MSGNLIDFAINVLENIVADIIILLFVSIIAYFGKSKIIDMIRMLRYSFRMNRNGIINFYNNREEYSTARREKNLNNYMLSAKKSFVYVGFYFSGATDRGRLDDAITQLLDRACKVEIILLDPDAPEETILTVERHLAIAHGTLRQILIHAHNHLQVLRSSLSIAAQNRFKIARHKEVLTCSAIMLDEGEPGGRMLVDNKIFMAGRDQSYGIEFRLNQECTGLCLDFSNSFKRISENSY